MGTWNETPYAPATPLRKREPLPAAVYDHRRCSPPGAADARLIERAVRRVVERHEILRSHFVLEGEAPVVRVGAASEVSVEVRDLRALPEAERLRILTEAEKAAAHVPFDLAREMPVRFTIFRSADDQASLLVSAHHIALDSWSFAVLARDLVAEYEAAAAGRPPLDPAAWAQALDEVNAEAG